MDRIELIGTVVPLVTPFAPDGSIDPRAMGRLVDYVLERGADALMPTALTGEGPLLDVGETTRPEPSKPRCRLAASMPACHAGRAAMSGGTTRRFSSA